MRSFIVIAALALGATSAAAMQAQPTTPAAPAESTTPTAPAARFSLDTPIEVLAADPGALEVLEANLPGITSHPAYPQFKSLSLRQVQPFSQGFITDEIMTRIGTALAALG